jgi:hypothetical protein
MFPALVSYALPGVSAIQVKGGDFALGPHGSTSRLLVRAKRNPGNAQVRATRLEDSSSCTAGSNCIHMGVRRTIIKVPVFCQTYNNQGLSILPDVQ